MLLQRSEKYECPGTYESESEWWLLQSEPFSMPLCTVCEMQTPIWTCIWILSYLSYTKRALLHRLTTWSWLVPANVASSFCSLPACPACTCLPAACPSVWSWPNCKQHFKAWIQTNATWPGLDIQSLRAFAFFFLVIHNCQLWFEARLGFMALLLGNLNFCKCQNLHAISDISNQIPKSRSTSQIVNLIQFPTSRSNVRDLNTTSEI